MSSTEEKKDKGFKQKLSKEALTYFNNVAKKPFSSQCVSFLDAYWAEVSTQAEFIFSFTLETMIYTDMHYKGCTLRHKYEEGVLLDFDAAIYMYEQMCKRLDKDSSDGKHWLKYQDKKKYKMSHTKMMTSLKRKKELKNKVDVNFDGKMSMLEFLLYQYKDFADPGDFIERSMALGDEPPEVRAARLALEKVMKKIRAYETKKQQLEKDAASNGGKGIKALRARNELAQLDSSPLKESLNKSLITAEAKVRIATKKYGGKSSISTDPDSAKKAGKGDVGMGGVWWIKRDLKEKKKKYGKKTKKK